MSDVEASHRCNANARASNPKINSTFSVKVVKTLNRFPTSLFVASIKRLLDYEVNGLYFIQITPRHLSYSLPGLPSCVNVRQYYYYYCAEVVLADKTDSKLRNSRMES